MSKHEAAYYDKKFPGRERRGDTLVFFWSCAVAGGFDGHHVLNASVWERLNDHDRRDRTSLRKEYDSADRAVHDLLRALA